MPRLFICTPLMLVFTFSALGKEISNGVTRQVPAAKIVRTKKPLSHNIVRQLDVDKVFASDKIRSKKAFGGKAVDLRARLCKGRKRNAPMAIRDAKEMTTVFKNPTVCTYLKTQVNFKHEQLIVIAWTGSRNDMPPVCQPGRPGKTVTFFEPVRAEVASKLIGHHIYLYVLNKNIKWVHLKKPQQASPHSTIKPAPSTGRIISVPGPAQAYRSVRPTVIYTSDELRKLAKGKGSFALLSKQIDFSKEALVLIPHQETSDSFTVKFMPLLLTNNSLRCHISRKMPSGDISDDKAYYCFAVAVNRTRVRVVQVQIAKQPNVFSLPVLQRCLLKPTSGKRTK